MTEPVRVHPHMLATTEQLLLLIAVGVGEGFEHRADPDIVAALDVDPHARHVLSMRALLDRVAGVPCEPFVRCHLLAKVSDSDEPTEQDHIDVRLRDYVALEVAPYDRSATTELVREMPHEALDPDHLTPIRSTP